jgi:hypothetical protein
MKNRENFKPALRTFVPRRLPALLAGRRLCSFRYAAGIVALFVPLAQGCGDTPSCAMTATCPPSDHADGGTAADVMPDSTFTTSDAGADRDAENEAGPDPIDAGSSARDDSSTSDATGSADDGGATSRDGASETDASSDNSGPLSGDAGAADRQNPVPTPDAAAVGDAPFRDGFTDAMVDAPVDVLPDVPVCDASPGRSPLEQPCLVDDAYGVFVSPTGSDVTGRGTRAAPFQTIGQGMRSAKPRTRVFVCDNGAGYSDPIVADQAIDGLALYGGFDCATWVPSAAARARVLPKDGPAIVLQGLRVGITLENFDLRAADAAVGASSIAARIDESVGVVFRRSRIASGKGGMGFDGRNGDIGQNGPPPGADQLGRAPFCATGVTQKGGVPVVSTCGSTGGNGGYGTNSTIGLRSNPGTDGQPMSDVSPANRPNAGTTCRSDTDTPGVVDGSRGADGTPGVPGASAPSGGTFSATGYEPHGPGGDGTDGHPAQGGGGGVGCPSSVTCVGPSGGAGGAGGCGGQHGTGGGAGGASIGLLSWRSAVVLDQCDVVSAQGGAGGRGGHGAMGGKGAAGGIGNEGHDGSDPSGAGGPGGEGGSGAAGAGGNGGPTYAIVFMGQRPAQISGTTVTSSGGPGGAGGTTPASPVSGSSRAADGSLGEAKHELAVP